MDNPPFALSPLFRKLTAFVATFALLATIIPLNSYLQPSSARAAGDLVAYWRFDEGAGSIAADSSGSGYTGAITNATYSATVPPVVFNDPYSLYFNPGSSGRIVTTNLSLNNYTEFTMAGWAYPTAANDRASWFGQNDLFEFGFADSNTLFCYTSKGEAFWDFNPGTFLNNWHHITCLATASQLIVYIDGVNVASAGIGAGSFGTSGSNFSIGAGAVDGGNSGPFSGYIDDVRVYSRGLTPEEMGDLGSGDAGPDAVSLPNISLTAPEMSDVINSWNPSVDWADSDSCEYSWDEEDWVSVDCEEAGADIDQPADGFNIELAIRAKYDDEESYAELSSTFTLDTVAPTVNAGDNRQTNVSFSQTTATASDTTSGIDSYAWTKSSGPGTVTFGNNQVLQPSITSISQDGTYVLRLTVTDHASNVAYDDVTVIWDTTNPDVTLDTFPSLFTKQTTANFAFSGSDALSGPVNFTCKLDDASFNSCTSPTSFDLEDGEHTLTVRAMDLAGNDEETTAYSWTIDTVAPVITLTSVASVTLVQGQAYSDAGATANDAVSGNVTSSILVVNPVNGTLPGQYTVRYNVSDQAGNAAVEVSRQVTVVSNEDLDDDGQADAVQDDIATIAEPFTGNPVAIKASDGCSVSNAALKEITQVGSDDSYTYPLGLLDFKIECVDPGATITVTQYYYDPPAESFQLRKFSNGNFVTVDKATITKQTINGREVLVVSYQITDGGELDDDGVVNGQIIDPAGPAVLAQTNEQIPNTGADAKVTLYLGVNIFLIGLLLAISQRVLRRHRRL